jgi:hypothetical protein
MIGWRNLLLVSAIAGAALPGTALARGGGHGGGHGGGGGRFGAVTVEAATSVEVVMWAAATSVAVVM